MKDPGDISGFLADPDGSTSGFLKRHRLPDTAPQGLCVKRTFFLGPRQCLDQRIYPAFSRFYHLEKGVLDHPSRMTRQPISRCLPLTPPWRNPFATTFSTFALVIGRKGTRRRGTALALRTDHGAARELDATAQDNVARSAHTETARPFVQANSVGAPHESHLGTGGRGPGRRPLPSALLQLRASVEKWEWT